MTTPDVFVTTDDPRWLMTIDGWTPKQEPAVEAVMALVNGYSGTRASLEEGSSVSTIATFLNGVFDAATEVVAQASATPDHQVMAAPTPELVVVPDWSKVRVIANGVPLEIEAAELLDQRRTLDMHRGVLVREWRLRHGTEETQHTTRLRSLRFASLADRHVLVQVLEVTPEDWSGSLSIEAMIDGTVTNEGNTQHLVETQTQLIDGGIMLSTATQEKRIQLCFATAAAATLEDNQPLAVETASIDTEIIQRWTFVVDQGQAATLRKIVTVFTSRDDDDPAARAAELLSHVIKIGVSTLLEQHVAAWATRWSTADVEIDGDDEAQRRTRFALYHLIGSANPDDEYASPGAR